MSLIRFNQDITLAFIQANHTDVERKMFSAGEFAEFTVQEDCTGFTLTSADGSYAPWIGREVFSILPENFELAPSAISRSSNKTTKQVLEAFPAPVPGTQFGNSWELPSSFNSLRVVRDAEVRSSLFDCSGTPVAYLRLVEGDGRRYDRLYYRCSFFGVPRRKVAKV